MKYNIKQFVIVFLILSLLLITNNKSQATESYRLPDTVRPNLYTLEISPDLENSNFTANEKITLVISKETKEIILNSCEIKIDNVKITNKKNNDTVNLEVTYDQENETAKFSSTNTLQVGTYVLSLNYKGILNDKLRGFYLSKYTDNNQTVHKIATTKMEPADARRMFPCFDEPAMKACYQITVKIDPGLTAISNSPISKHYLNKQENKEIVEFMTSPKMSTYLVALIVGPFASTEPINKDGCEIRVWSVKDKIKLGDYARNRASELLSYYNNYFNIKYPLPKLDLIAIPDFASGAMENFGAITFRETALLIDDKTSSVDRKQTVTSIVAHEIAHMWFGDLVTMAWWDDLWLNEAFATWMSVKAVDNLEPNWQYYIKYITWRLYAMNIDSLKCSRPIHNEVHSPAQAVEMFDNITYLKGSAILKMIETWVGNENFRLGVSNYLKAHLYGNATTNDLWKDIETQSGKPVQALAQTFVNQPGYPLLTLRVSKNNKLEVSQQQFFLNKDTVGNHNAKWLIPLTACSFKSKNSLPLSYVINDSLEEIQDYQCFEPYKANIYASGYYRTNYNDTNFNLLKNNLQKYLTPSERLSFLNDQWNLTKSLNINFSDFINLLNEYKTEKDTYVIKEMITTLYDLYNYVPNDKLNSFALYANSILKETFATTGQENKPNDSTLTKSLRSNLLTFLGTCGQNKKILANCQNYLNSTFYKDSPIIDGDKLRTALLVVAFNGTKHDYNSIYNQYLKAKSPEIKTACLFALANFRSTDLISKTLNLSLSDKVKTQDGPHLIAACFSNPVGLAPAYVANPIAQIQALAFFKSHFTDLNNRFVPRYIPLMIQAMASITNQNDLTDIQAFFKEHPLKLGNQSLTETLEIIASNVKFKKANSTKINAWLDCLK